MSDDWENDDSRSPGLLVKGTDRWEGEDEEEVKDNWDDEDEEDTKPKTTDVPVQPRKKKTLTQIIAEKEEKLRLEQEERRRRAEAEQKAMSPEEQSAEKLRRQKMQEESDLRTAMETFGVKTTGTIDSITPVSLEDYDNLRKLLVAKLAPNERSELYLPFLQDLLHDLTMNLDYEDIKKLGSGLNALANEKLKLSKGAKTKKKKGVSLKVERTDMEAYGEKYVEPEYDDFM